MQENNIPDAATDGITQPQTLQAQPSLVIDSTPVTFRQRLRQFVLGGEHTIPIPQQRDFSNLEPFLRKTYGDMEIIRIDEGNVLFGSEEWKDILSNQCGFKEEKELDTAVELIHNFTTGIQAAYGHHLQQGTDLRGLSLPEIVFVRGCSPAKLTKAYIRGVGKIIVNIDALKIEAQKNPDEIRDFYTVAKDHALAFTGSQKELNFFQGLEEADHSIWFPHHHKDKTTTLLPQDADSLAIYDAQDHEFRWLQVGADIAHERGLLEIEKILRARITAATAHRPQTQNKK